MKEDRSSSRRVRQGRVAKIVQSLNSPFFPPHIEAEPGRAKEESRITYMRMLRTNQSKITGPNPAARVNVSRNAFFNSRSERKHIFFDFDIIVKT